MVDLLADTWQPRDLPFLVEAVRAVDRGEQAAETDELAERAGLEVQAAQRAAAALHGAGYINGSTVDQFDFPLDVSSVSPEARRLAGAWPSDDVAADRLEAALNQLIERSTGEERSRLVRLRDGLASAGRDVVVSLAAAVLSGQVG